MSSNDPYQFPKLRWPIQVQHEEIDGNRIIILTCPLGITEQPLGLHAAVAPILQHFQGTLPLTEILTRLAPAGCTQEILDQLITIVFVGHETTAVMLACAWASSTIACVRRTLSSKGACDASIMID